MHLFRSYTYRVHPDRYSMDTQTIRGISWVSCHSWTSLFQVCEKVEVKEGYKNRRGRLQLRYVLLSSKPAVSSKPHVYESARSVLTHGLNVDKITTLLQVLMERLHSSVESELSVKIVNCTCMNSYRHVWTWYPNNSDVLITTSHETAVLPVEQVKGMRSNEITWVNIW